MTFLTGFPFFIVIINLPLRFQLVNGDTPLMAGVRLIPMLGISAFGNSGTTALRFKAYNK
jgi:hypothetical protein